MRGVTLLTVILVPSALLQTAAAVIAARQVGQVDNRYLMA